VPRLSLWKDGRHSNDYRFFDRIIREQFTVGGTGILLHKYLGPNSQGNQLATSGTQTVGNKLTFVSTGSVNIGDAVTGNGIPNNTLVTAKDATTVTLSKNTSTMLASSTTVGFSNTPTQPSYTNQTASNIQDLLWLENRDRKYDTSVYKMRGIYQVTDTDFDLSQFGLFLATNTLFMAFHLNDMIDTVGRKIMNGDVIELQHLTDYTPLNDDLPAALKRFYVISDTGFPSEGYSPTWWPHLWRCKINPLVDSQEYKDILNNISSGDANNTPLGQLLSTYNTTIAINDAVIQQAESDVPLSGYDTSRFFVKPLNTQGDIIDNINRTADQTNLDASGIAETTDASLLTPDAKIPGYLVGDGIPPDGFPVTAGTAFPNNPKIGDFALRTDYLPNRLFRYDGGRWAKVEDVQRTGLTQGAGNQTQLGTFVNNSSTYIDSQGKTHSSKQSLSKALTPKADNQ
jgi:hypothetical protein